MIASAKGRVRAQASYGNITVLNHLKFGTVVYLEIPGIAKFYWFLILQNDRKFMWQKEQQVGSHMACAPFVKLIK